MSAVYIVNLILLLAISFIDIRKNIIPNVLVFLLLIFNVLFDIFYIKLSLSSILIKCLMLIIVFIATYVLHSITGLGLGDVKLLSVLAYIQSPLIFVISVFFASFCGIIITLFIKWGCKKDIKKIPFAPYITFGVVIGEMLRRFIL